MPCDKAKPTYREARETLWAQTDWSTVSLLLVVLTKDRETLQRGQGNLTERPGKPYSEARETLWARTDWSTVSLLLVVLTQRPEKPYREARETLQRGQGNLVGSDRLEHGIAVVGCTYREQRNLTVRPGKPYREARETLQ